MSIESELRVRVEELELKVTFQDDLIDKLNEALIKQQSDLRLLTKLVEKMNSEVQDMRPNSVVDQAQETPPPHY